VVEFAVSPERTALLNVDVQNYFVQPAYEGDQLIGRVNQLAHVCLTQGSWSFTVVRGLLRNP
jgi:isochorismate hydrolase